MRAIQESIKTYEKSSNELAAARVRFSQEWQIARVKVSSDMHANQIAIEKTKDEVTRLTAANRAAELTLQYAMRKDSISV